MTDTIPPGAIPADQFIADQEAPNPNGLPPGAIPIEQFQSDQDKYGTPTEMFKTAAEQALSGATLGASKVAETHLLGVSPNAIAGREAANPITSSLSNIGGTAALLYGTGGLGELAKGASTAAKIAAGGVEGAGIGGINQATDDWSQNKALDAQKIAASAGLGALLGAGGAGIVAKLAPEAAEAVEAANPPSGPSGTAILPSDTISGSVVDAPPLEKTGVQPTTVEDVKARVQKAMASDDAVPLPQQGALLDAVNRTPMENPVNPLQLSSLGSQEARDLYQTGKEMPGIGQALQGNEALQKAELVGKLGDTVSELSPGSEPIADAAKGGQTAIDAFTDQYQDEKEALKPIFDGLKQLPYNGDLLVDTVDRMVQALPRVADMLDAEGGELSIRPYTTDMGIDKATYKAVKQVVDSLNNESVPDSFQKLWDIRKGLDQNVDVLSKGQAPAEISKLKAGMMTQMQDSANNPDIREAFRRYAINEQQRGVIEKTFGAAVGSPEFGAISKIKPEYIGDRIFGNTASVNAAKSILPPEQFQTLLANWIQENIAKVTDKGAFSSNKFGTFLRNNQDALNVAFSDNPQALQRLRDLTTIMRILPDAPPINPSGTAKTLYRMLSNFNVHNLTWEGMLAHIPKKIAEEIAHRGKMTELNQALAGQTAKNVATVALQKASAKTSLRLDRGIRSLFSGSATIARRLH